MTHACDRCGAAVEDGVSFCGGCGAPQIRVAAPASPLYAAGPSSGAPSLPPGTIAWPHGLPAALIAGLGAGFLSVTPIVGLGVCLWLLAGGAAAVAIYRHRQPAAPMSAGTGARLGSVTGVFAFGVYAVVTALEMLVSGRTLREVLRRALEQSAARNPDPRAQEIMQKLTSPEGLALIVTLTFVVLFFVFVIFCSIGGAVYASMQPREEK